MDITENIKLSIRSIRSNALRTTLTFLIIAIGIMALVGILTAIDSINSSINNQFSSMGANTFTIRNRGLNVRMGHRGKRPKVYPEITYEQAKEFKARHEIDGIVTVSAVVSQTATIVNQSVKTNPNVTVFGVDDNYLAVMGMKLISGRNFSRQELITGSNVIILGYDVYKKIFGNQDSVIDKHISIGNLKYLIIGVLEAKGASVVSSDNMVLLPLTNSRRVYPSNNPNYTISIAVNDPRTLDHAIAEATGLMRIVRRLKPEENNNFEIIRSDRLAGIMIEQLKYVAIAATVIGFVTLFGAAIGLMNIMLVSVTERTREIGISKAIGATKREILSQFLTEAIVICQIGGVLGVLLGILAGNGVSMLLNGGFIIPWKWIIAGISLCFFVGLVAGIYPANKAANLDPIEALRYE